MEKRGFLLAEETLKIVVALICLGFLIYFLAALYMSNANAQKLKQADEILSKSGNSIGSTINSLKDGESIDFNLESPGGWYLFNFHGNEEPASCGFESCICICDSALPIIGNQVSKCETTGVCLSVPKLNSFEKIYIKSAQEGLTQIEIKKENGAVSIIPKA